MIECPKCAAPSADAAVECPRCGIVFAKYEHRSLAANLGVPPPIVEAPRRIAADSARRAAWLARVTVLAGLALWTWQFARSPMGTGAMLSVLHLPNLVFHEAGHVLFGVFGRFISVLGGSLLQFALPLALAGVFLKQRDPFGAAVCTWWAGENLLDLAPYVADARALQLVLLGGKTGAEVEGHDWEYLLTQMGWMRYDRPLGLWAHRLGLAMMVGALIWAGLHLAAIRDGAPERPVT